MNLFAKYFKNNFLRSDLERDDFIEKGDELIEPFISTSDYGRSKNGALVQNYRNVFRYHQRFELIKMRGDYVGKLLYEEMKYGHTDQEYYWRFGTNMRNDPAHFFIELPDFIRNEYWVIKDPDDVQPEPLPVKYFACCIHPLTEDQLDKHYASEAGEYSILMPKMAAYYFNQQTGKFKMIRNTHPWFCDIVFATLHLIWKEETSLELVVGKDSGNNEPFVKPVVTDRLIEYPINNITVIDKNYLVQTIRVNPFNVRAHNAIRACGQGRKDRRVVSIKGYQKSGYTTSITKRA